MHCLIYDPHPAGYVACRLLSGAWDGCRTTRLGGLRLEDRDPPPLPGGDWVRVRTLLGGVCGTDTSILGQAPPPDSILEPFGSRPMMLGHENVAVVEQTGPEVDPSWEGTRVCVEPTLGCTARGIDPPCRPCSDGQFGACENFGAAGEGRYALPAGTSIGYNAVTGGSWGEQFVAHVSQLVPVPDQLLDELAVLTDPLACSLHAALRANLDGASQVLVIGPGMLGLGLIACLRSIGYAGRLDAVGVAGYTLGFAKQLGADEAFRLPRGPARHDRIARRTGATVHRARFGNRMLSGGYDVIFDCAGTARTFSDALKWTAARGQVVLVATGSGGKMDLTPVWFRELDVRGIYGRAMEQWNGERVGTYELVHRFMCSGKLDAGRLLTHTFPLSDYRRALDAAMHKEQHEAIKVAFDFR